jgi:hypothetical protein
MIRLIAVGFALALASSVQAMPPAPLAQPDETVIQVREGCGEGMRRTAGGACVRTRSHYRGAPADGGAGGDGMADNPNATSADPNAMMANPSSVNGASGSVVRYGEAHQQRSYSDNQ